MSAAHSAQRRSGLHVAPPSPRLGRRMARFNRAVTNKVLIHVAALVPGMGVVTDDEMLALQRAGYGRNYRITSEWATITDKEATAPETIPLNTVGR